MKKLSLFILSLFMATSALAEHPVINCAPRITCTSMGNVNSCVMRGGGNPEYFTPVSVQGAPRYNYDFHSAGVEFIKSAPTSNRVICSYSSDGTKPHVEKIVFKNIDPTQPWMPNFGAGNWTGTLSNAKCGGDCPMFIDTP